MKIVATIEARMTSSRLPGKVLMDLAGQPALKHIIQRLKSIPEIDEVVLATTTNEGDTPLVELATDCGVKIYRGSEEDVLGRVLAAAKSVGADLLVEITGDCPLVDPKIVSQAIGEFKSRLGTPEEVDYLSNVLKPGYPLGLAVQVFPVAVLEEISKITQDPRDREHVSLYIYEKPGRYRLHHLDCPDWLKHPDWRWTLDVQEDYDFLSRVFNALFQKEKIFSSKELVSYLNEHPELIGINTQIKQKGVRD